MSGNIILIGMPGSGKSTLGVLLAKALGMDFADTDIIIQQREGRLLQEIIDADGIDGFLRAEESAILGLRLERCVIATGGSAVYSERAMRSLGAGGVVVYLSLPYDELGERLTNISRRGVVIKPGSSLFDVYRERLPLYRKYSDITVDCSGRTVEECVAEVLAALH